MTTLIGARPSDTLTSAERATTGKGFDVLDRYDDHAGNEWLYVKAGAAIPQYNVVTVFASGTATVFSSAAVAGGVAAARWYGIAASASIASDSFGWVMVKGKAAVKVSASSTGTISGQLYASSSAGGAGLVAATASGNVKLTTLFAQATATTSTTGSTVPVVFGYILTSA